MINLKKFTILIPIILLLVTGGTRLYKFNSPLADWHSWRQTDTSAVSRSFVQQGFDLLHPRFNDISNVASGKDNPEGYRFVEFPLYNAVQAMLFVLFGHFSIEAWGRILSMISSTIAALFLYFIIKKYTTKSIAFFSTFFYALLPFSIFYGRAVLPDQSMVTAVLGGIYFFDSSIKDNLKFPPAGEAGQISPIKSGSRMKTIIGTNLKFILAIIFTAAALLLKPYALFFTLPMLVIAWQRYGKTMFIKWQLWIFAILSILPLIFWRLWMMHYPEGIPVSDWLFNGGGIRFKGAYFYWIFADRLGRLILGYWGMGLLIIGILITSSPVISKKVRMFFYSFLLSSLLYILIIARGNVQHDYYQILIIPSLAIFLGIGADFLCYPPKDIMNKLFSRIILFITILFTLGFGWYFVRAYYNINNPSIIVAGEAVDRLTPKDAKVIAPYDGDTTFLYYTNRKGWASFQNSLPELIVKGATHLVFVNPKPGEYDFGKIYKVISYSKEYVLFDLRQKP